MTIGLSRFRLMTVAKGALSIGACTLLACGSPDAPEKIRIGQAVSITGPLAPIHDVTVKPIYEMWIDELNADGGIYIDEYGKKLPIELIQYDDEGDPAKLKVLLEQLMLEDKVDFLLPPVATHMLLEAAPLADKYGYILMGGPGGASKLKEISSGLPYFFSVLNFADTQMPALADVLEEVGVERAAILFVDEQHGIEYSGVLVPELARRGIDVVLVKAHPPNAPDIATILGETMAEADALEADAFIGLTYPDATYPAPGVAMSMGYQPKIMHMNVGTAFGSFKAAYGPAAEGIVGPGAWNAQTSGGALEFEEKFNELYPDVGVDYWGGLFYYSSCQFFRQAIERAGSLDQAKIRDIMATETFDTALGPMKFENGLNVARPGEIGQWQNGVFEVLAPADKRTAAPIYPKPAWPAAPAQ